MNGVVKEVNEKFIYLRLPGALKSDFKLYYKVYGAIIR